jgi:phosphohistidine phosphatase
MNLYVLRHAQAAPLGEALRRDADRLLTDRGVADATLAGVALSKLDSAIALLLCSPLQRARQTAELAAAQFPMPPGIRETENLSPGFRPPALVSELKSIPPDGSVVVVGHQPDLGRFISHVIEAEPSASIELPPAALAHIRFATDATSEASLRWLLTPEMLKILLSPR